CFHIVDISVFHHVIVAISIIYNFEIPQAITHMLGYQLLSVIFTFLTGFHCGHIFYSSQLTFCEICQGIFWGSYIILIHFFFSSFLDLYPSLNPIIITYLIRFLIWTVSLISIPFLFLASWI